MKSLFCQFWTDILEFGGQLAILIPISLRIHKFEFYVHVCLIPNTFPHKYKLCHAYTWRYRQHCRQPFWVLAAILDFSSSGTCIPCFFRCIIILRTYSEKCLLVSRYWLHLYRTKSLMSKIGQFLTDILNFGGHLDFLFTQNSYIWILCSYSIYFDMNTNFVAKRQGDIDNIIHCRQPFWVLAAILDSGWVTTCVSGFFWSYIYVQHILKIACWYHEVKYSGTIWHVQIALYEKE